MQTSKSAFVHGLCDFNFVKLRGINENIEFFQNTNKITIVACGTSWHAGLVGEYLIEGIAKTPVEVEFKNLFCS